MRRIGSSLAAREYSGAMTKVITHEPDASRYTLTVDGQVLALADYRINGNSISFNHTYTQPSHRGQGLAAEVVDYAKLNNIRPTDFPYAEAQRIYLGTLKEMKVEGGALPMPEADVPLISQLMERL